jgi:hypothetical protein
METIFNYNITIDETKILNILNPTRRIVDKIVYETPTDINQKYADLCRLFFMRGNPQAAEEYSNKMEEPENFFTN